MENRGNCQQHTGYMSFHHHAIKIKIKFIYVELIHREQDIRGYVCISQQLIYIYIQSIRSNIN